MCFFPFGWLYVEVIRHTELVMIFFLIKNPNPCLVAEKMNNSTSTVFFEYNINLHVNLKYMQIILDTQVLGSILLFYHYCNKERKGYRRREKEEMRKRYMQRLSREIESRAL